MKIDIPSELYIREKYLEKIRGFYHEYEMIKVISGVRRCGKSFLMKTIIKELLEQGINENNILYFHLDKRPYASITTSEQLDKLIEENSRINGKKYLFIDEIQNVKDFEIVINSWREEGDFSIFITGSNSYLLSGELATKLTGRYVEFNMYPLSFEEYIGMKKYLGKDIKESNTELNNYILEGGFPYALKLDNLMDKRTYIKNLIDEIYKKDIQSRIKIRNRAVFDAVMTYVINNFGATTSISNIENDFREKNILIKKETINRYIKALINAKVLYECKRFDMKSRKSIMGEQKYYLADLSFYYALNTDNRINYGPTLENVFYLYAASNGYDISIGRIGKLECDFILRNQNLDYAYIQIAYTILSSKETEDREYAPLEKTSDNYPKYVMTNDVLLQKRSGINHVNLVDFILKGTKL